MRRLALALVPLLLLACTEREPVEPTMEHNPAFNFMNNPDNGNPQVWRNEWAAAYRWFDGTLRMTVTTFPLNNQGSCGTPIFLDDWQWLDLVFGPDWTDPVTRLIENEQQNEVWIVVDDVATGWVLRHRGVSWRRHAARPRDWEGAEQRQRSGLRLVRSRIDVLS